MNPKLPMVTIVDRVNALEKSGLLQKWADLLPRMGARKAADRVGADYELLKHAYGSAADNGDYRVKLIWDTAKKKSKGHGEAMAQKRVSNQRLFEAGLVEKVAEFIEKVSLDDMTTDPEIRRDVIAIYDKYLKSLPAERHDKSLVVSGKLDDLKPSMTPEQLKAQADQIYAEIKEDAIDVEVEIDPTGD